MKWQSSTQIMLFGSIILGFFITSSLLVNSVCDIKISLTKFYQALWMALWMVLLELAMYPSAPALVYVATFIVIVAVFYLARNQVLVNDKEYLKAMIQHHSSAILTSDQILKKTENEKVRKLAQWISKSQQEEIDYMNSLLH
uniref:DUF305 domain-containing protein n=1 Tax=Marseillevirus LCMAC202 TaxID=2506606 RepID=A0A481YXH9_9VIRU|nr:MAG: protein of unknown function DUF305 [Marseillevirus LCMAC202]